VLQGPTALAIRRRCALLGVSRSGCYAWCGRPTSPRAAENAQLVRVMREIHATVDRTYGSRGCRPNWPSGAGSAVGIGRRG